MRTVAALYVETEGAYSGLDGVDAWDEARDARFSVGQDPAAHTPARIGVARLRESPPDWHVGDGCGGKDKTKVRNATPPEFRDVLLSIARSVSLKA